MNTNKVQEDYLQNKYNIIVIADSKNIDTLHKIQCNIYNVIDYGINLSVHLSKVSLSFNMSI